MLLEQLNADLKTAMKSGDELKKSVIRMLLSEIKIAQTRPNAGELTEQAVVQAVQGYHKKLTKAMAEYWDEAKTALQKELDVVEQYLPKRASEDDIRKAIEEVLSSTEAREIGPLTGMVMKKLAGADGKTVNALLRAKLGSN